MREIFSTKQENTNFNAKKLIAGAAITLSAFGLTSCKDTIVETVSSNSGDNKNSSVLYNADCSAQDPGGSDTDDVYVTMRHSEFKTQEDLINGLYEVSVEAMIGDYNKQVYTQEQLDAMRESVALAVDQRFKGDVASIEQGDGIHMDVVEYGNTTDVGERISGDPARNMPVRYQAPADSEHCAAFSGDRGADNVN